MLIWRPTFSVLIALGLFALGNMPAIGEEDRVDRVAQSRIADPALSSEAEISRQSNEPDCFTAHQHVCHTSGIKRFEAHFCRHPVSGEQVLSWTRSVTETRPDILDMARLEGLCADIGGNVASPRREDASHQTG